MKINKNDLYKVLIESLGDSCIPFETQKQIMQNIKSKLDSILAEKKDKKTTFIEINYDTLIEKLTFHDDKLKNNSIILWLQQDYSVYTVKDLLNVNLDLHSFLKYKSVKYIKKEITRLKKKLQD